MMVLAKIIVLLIARLVFFSLIYVHAARQVERTGLFPRLYPCVLTLCSTAVLDAYTSHWCLYGNPSSLFLAVGGGRLCRGGGAKSLWTHYRQT